MEILELRQITVSLIGDLIGSYILPNGVKQPSLYVSGRYGVPKEWKAIGLEIIIKQYPEISIRPLLGLVRRMKLWEVMLSQYSPESENLDKAVDRITRFFPDATVRNFPYADREYQYTRIVIPDEEITFRQSL